MKLNSIKYLFVHHTAVSRSVLENQFDVVNNYHKTVKNADGTIGFKLSSMGYYVGYNYMISADGTIKQFRIDGEETCAQLNHNNDSISICLCGNFDNEMPTTQQVATLKKFITDKSLEHNIDLDNVLPHRCSYDIDGVARQKSCYGSLLSDSWARDLVLSDLQNKVSILSSIVKIMMDLINIIFKK